MKPCNDGNVSLLYGIAVQPIDNPVPERFIEIHFELAARHKSSEFCYIVRYELPWSLIPTTKLCYDQMGPVLQLRNNVA